MSADALRGAIRRGDCAEAARLLASGADPAGLDVAGEGAPESDARLTLLHRIRQEYQRLPVAPHDAETNDPVLQALERDGIVRVPGLVGEPQLELLQREIGRFARRLDWARRLRRARFRHYDQKRYFHEPQKSYVTNDAFEHVPALLPWLAASPLLRLADTYLRKPASLKRAYFMRYLPAPEMTASQFHWHHDMEDKQLKAMLLLTDVPEGGQRMSYLRGSHRAFHPYERFLKNHLDFEYCATYLDDIEVVETTGRAGDVFLFDSNGMHRGNRSPGSPARDAVFLEFTADRNRGNVWGSDLQRDTIPPALDEHPAFATFLAVEPKWQRTRQGRVKRRRPTWAASLEDPSVWL